MKNKIKNSIILTSLALIAIFIINKIISAISVMKNLLSTDGGQFFDWRFGKVFYTRNGSGSPVLLLHELTPYSSSIEWTEIVKELSKNHTVFTVDLLGSGRSDKPNITYTNYLYVQLISDFIRNVIHKKTDVIATGVTSSAVLMACYNDENLFRKMMFINPSDLNELNKIPSKRSKALKLLLETPLIGTLVYNVLTSRKNIENMFVEEYLFNPFHIRSKYLNSYYEAAHLGGGNSKYLLSSLKGRYMNVNISKALENINNSIYLVGGVEEPDIKNTIQSYVNLNNSIEYGYIPRSKHLPQIESSSQLMEQISIFF